MFRRQSVRRTIDRPMIDPWPTGAAFLWWEQDERVWSPIPTQDEVEGRGMAPVSVENGSIIEVHGKLYERPWMPELTYYDDIGIPSVPIQVTFDGDLVDMEELTGNDTAVVAPFEYTGNGTFGFTLHLDKPAGAYELVLRFDGWPEVGSQVYRPLTHTAIIHVSHPAELTIEASTSRVLAGEKVELGGTLSDDTGSVIPEVPVQVWWEDRLLGPISLGVYIDDVEVEGAGFSDDADNGTHGWATYSASPVDNQWEHGTPSPPNPPLPPDPHYPWSLWGTNLDGHYQRGAWSFLVSPLLNMSEDISYVLRFWAWWSLPSDDDQAYVAISRDYGETWEHEASMVFTSMALVPSSWQRIEFDISRYSGSDHIRFAFVFRSPAKTVDTGADGNFSYVHAVPASSQVDRILVRVLFPGDLLHEMAESVVQIAVIRPTVINMEVAGGTGFRGQPTTIRGRLTDDRGEVLAHHVDGQEYYFMVNIIMGGMGGAIENGIIPPPFSGVRVDPETGEFSKTLVVDTHQPLGPMNVTVRFAGGEFYTGVKVVEVFAVKAHVQIVPPPPEERRFHRGEALNITAHLRLVPEESTGDRDRGDPIPDEWIKVFWGGQQLNTRRTYFNGLLRVEYRVPIDHELGPVMVLFSYGGSDIYEPVNLTVEYMVISDTFITLDAQTVKKGEWATITGRITDDRGGPVPFVPVYIIWKRAPEIGRQTSRVDGTFSLQYYVEYEDRVGNVTVIARFKGDSVYGEGEGQVNYTVVVPTILQRRDRTLVAVQGSSVKVQAKLYEDWGGFRGTEVQRAEVVLTVNGEVLASKRTAFDGSVSFTVYLDPLVFEGGDIDVVLRFNGTDHLLGAVTRTTIFVRVDLYITLDLEVEGRAFDRFSDIARFDDGVEVSIGVHDGLREPIEGLEVSVYYREEWFPLKEGLLWTGRTDAFGGMVFRTVLLGERSGNVSFIVVVPGLAKGMYPWFTIAYIVPPPPSREHIIETSGDTDVEAGSRLDLRVKVRYTERWDLDNLTFDLVDAPDGMTVSPDGTITWRPTGDQSGEHTFRVWLFDGERSETASLTIHVQDRSGLAMRTGVASATLAMSAFAVAYLASRVRRERRSSG